MERYTRLEKKMTRSDVISSLDPTGFKLFTTFVEDFFAVNKIAQLNPDDCEQWKPIDFGPARVKGPPKDRKTFYRHRNALVDRGILTCVTHGELGEHSKFTLGKAILSLFDRRKSSPTPRGNNHPVVGEERPHYRGKYPPPSSTSKNSTTATHRSCGEIESSGKKNYEQERDRLWESARREGIHFIVEDMDIALEENMGADPATTRRAQASVIAEHIHAEGDATELMILLTQYGLYEVVLATLEVCRAHNRTKEVESPVGLLITIMRKRAAFQIEESGRP